MIRVVISLEEEDKAWLQHIAEAQDISMAEVMRQAIHCYRQESKVVAGSSLRKALTQTKGIWKHGDGLKYQKKIRSEWGK